MTNTEAPYLYRVNFWKRLVLSCVTLAILYFWYSGMMLHDVYDSPFQYKGADLTYWIMHWLHLPQVILFNEVTAWIFDLGLVLSLIMSIALIEKRGFTILAGVCLLLYQLLFNYKIGYHTHHLFGFHFALLPFYFRVKMFDLTARFAGILCCLSYAFAGISKLYHQAWTVFNSFSDILQSQHAAYLYLHPESLRSKFVLWMIQHPACGYLFFLSAMVLQLSFIAGLFTTRWNRLLALWIMLFHVMDWWLMNLGIFMGMTVMAWLFLYTPQTKVRNNL